MVHEFTPSVDLPFYIYCLGYILSLVSLSLGLAVFIHFKQVFSFIHRVQLFENRVNRIRNSWYRLHAFRWRCEGEQVNSYGHLFSRDLRCLRNTIHANLFLTYILAALLWLSITLIYQVSHCITSINVCGTSIPAPTLLPTPEHLFFGGRPTHFPTMRCRVDDTTMTVDLRQFGFVWCAPQLQQIWLWESACWHKPWTKWFYGIKETRCALRRRWKLAQRAFATTFGLHLQSPCKNAKVLQPNLYK